MFYFWVQCVQFGGKTGRVNDNIDIFRYDTVERFLLKHSVNVGGTENALR